MTEQPSDGALQIAARSDHVEHAVVEQKLGGLKAFREILPERRLETARAGEAAHGLDPATRVCMRKRLDS